MTVSLRLPWPPTVNTYWRFVPKNGAFRVLISSDGRKYRREVARLVALLHRDPAWCQAAARLDIRPGSSLAVVIDAYPPDYRHRDLDNLPKAILDSLTHAGLWPDDYQIDDLHIRRRQVVKPAGMITLTLSRPGPLTTDP